MSKNIVIISSTPRKNGNSEILAEAFEKGAKENGCNTKIIRLRELQLNFCKGCFYCQNNNKCIINDSVNNLLSDIQNADILVFATPIYYYEMTGQLKTFLDRLNPLYPRANKFKEVYLLATAADSDNSAMDGAIKGVQGWISCFEGVTLKGIIRGLNVNGVNEIKNLNAEQEAYKMGKSIK